MKKMDVAPEVEAVVFILAMMLTVVPFSVRSVFAQDLISEIDQQEEPIGETEGMAISEDDATDFSQPADEATVTYPPTAEFKGYEIMPNSGSVEGEVTVLKPETNIIERQIDQAQPSAVIGTEYIDTYEYKEPEVQNVKPEFQAIEPTEQPGPSVPIHTEYKNTDLGSNGYGAGENIEVLKPEFKAIEPAEQAGPSAVIHAEDIEEYRYEEPATEGLSEEPDYGMGEGE